MSPHLASNVVPLVPPKRTPKVNLDKKSVIDRLPYAPRGKQQLYWDTKMPGYGLVVGLISKTFIVQRDINGKTKRVTVGKYGDYTPKQARDKAIIFRSEMGRGIDPNEAKAKEKAQRITLREALNDYKTTRKNLTERTKSWYTGLFGLHLPDWLDKNLRDITPDMVKSRHTQIAERIKAKPRFKNSPNYKGSTVVSGGPSANVTMIALRAIYNYALIDNENLPANPVKRLSAKQSWYPGNHRTGQIKAADLKPWLAAISNVPNDVHRDYALLVLATGLRKNEAATIEWKNVDLEAKTLHIPVTKNKRTLDLPLSNFLITLLTARKARCGDSLWVFPAYSKSGHIEATSTALNWAAKECGIQVTVHDLRRTFITIAESCEVPHYVFKALVNHSTAGDVTGSHYVQMSVERMRPWMEKISNQLFS